MKKQYDQVLASALIQRMKNGESLNTLQKETGIGRATLWRWRQGLSYPQSGISKSNPEEYYNLHKEEILERVKGNKYGGLYFQVLQRDNYECQNCHSKESLVEHHINGNHEDNRMENLVTLCQKCHRAIHLVVVILKRIPPFEKLYDWVLLLMENGPKKE